MATTQEKIDGLDYFDFKTKLQVILTELNATKVYPTYANNAAAIAGGLAVNDIYKTSAGVLNTVV